MNELDTPKKYIKVVPLIILTAIIVGSSVYLLMKQRGTNLQNNFSNSSSDIAVGKPCDARNLKSYNGGGEIANTKGLQCYMYDNLSDYPIHNGQWTYPTKQGDRKGVWIYPNHMSIPVFLALAQPSLFDNFSLDDFTQNWKQYNNPVGNYNFKFPSQWKVKSDVSEPNQLTIQELSSLDNGVGAGAPLQFTITYHPKIKFESTDDFKNIAEAPDDWLVSDTSSDTFVYTKHFDLNGTPALLVQRMGNSDLGASPYDITVYVTKPDSYFTIAYTKFQNLDIDLAVEMLIKTLRFN